MNVRRWAVWTLIVAAALGGSGPSLADEEMFYYVDDGNVVITNTPSRADVRPVPAKEVETELDLPSVLLPPTPFDPYIDIVAAESGLSPALLKAVALVESGFDPRAVSPKGAGGLMQLMPATARQYGVTDVFDPLQNLRAGATHLRGLLDEFGGDLTLALAAYNAGEGAVRRHGGVPDYRETKDYIRKVHEKLDREPGRSVVPARLSAATVRLVPQADGSVLLLN